MERNVVLEQLDADLKHVQNCAGKALQKWHAAGKGPDNPAAYARLPRSMRIAYQALSDAFESSSALAEMAHSRAADALYSGDAYPKNASAAERAEIDAEAAVTERRAALARATAALTVADEHLHCDETTKSGLATGPDFGGVKAGVIQSLAVREKRDAGIEAEALHSAENRADAALDRDAQVHAARQFIIAIVKSYSAVYDDPTAGAPLAPAGADVSPAAPVVRKEPRTPLEKQAVEQVHKAYLAAMKVQDAFQAGQVDKGLALYADARKEAVKAYHTLCACPDYQPEARKAIGKALTALERDPGFGKGLGRGVA